jgi:MFS superfamily sulfate permease-like transporter
MLRLDFITEYFSEPLVGGFSTGISLYVVVSQIRPLLGIPKPSMKKLGYEFPVSFYSVLGVLGVLSF